jgi:hypothetical protein
MMTGHKWRGYMSKRLATGRAILRSDQFGPHPVAFGCALRIDALNRGTRHKGHCELSLRRKFRLQKSLADWENIGWAELLTKLSRERNKVSMKKRGI